MPLQKRLVVEFERGSRWLKIRPKVVLWAVGISIALAVLVFSGATAAAAVLLAWGALSQAATASDRHQEQTNADRQRHITESFAKAVELLGSNKLEVRLGGIYSLERISKESPDDYWPVMETLTAFVREHSTRNEPDRKAQDVGQRVSQRAYFLWLEAGCPDGGAEEHWAEAVKQDELGKPPTADIAAVLTVIKRRTEQSQERERANAWRLDLAGAILKQANLVKMRLEGADLTDARLQGANLMGAHLDGAFLEDARFDGAILIDTHFKGATLVSAHLGGGTIFLVVYLEGAVLIDAHLEGAILNATHLEGALLANAHLEGTNLERATGLSTEQLAEAFGDARTRLPPGMKRPANWPAAEEPPDAAA